MFFALQYTEKFFFVSKIHQNFEHQKKTMEKKNNFMEFFFPPPFIEIRSRFFSETNAAIVDASRRSERIDLGSAYWLGLAILGHTHFYASRHTNPIHTHTRHMQHSIQHADCSTLLMVLLWFFVFYLNSFFFRYNTQPK